MQHYFQTHIGRVQVLDSEFKELLSKTTDEEEIKQEVLQMWYHEVSINETISEQLWVKRQDFLTRKKEEEEATNSHQITRSDDDNRRQVKIKGRPRLLSPSITSRQHAES